MGRRRYDRTMLTVVFSRRLAVLAGFALPTLETWRRWREWPGPIENWIPWADDYLLGAILLTAAWISRASGSPPATDGWLERPDRTRLAGPTTSQGVGPTAAFDWRLGVRPASWLTGGWGFVCGVGFGSFLAQLNYAINPALGDYNEPSGLSDAWMALIKGILVAIGLVGLLASMRPEPQAPLRIPDGT